MENKSLRKTIYGLILITVLLFAAGIIVFKVFFPSGYFAFFPFMLLFFLVVHAGFFFSFYRSLKKSHNQFVRNFMASTAIKLVLLFLFIVAYFLLSPQTSIPFAISLSIAYLAYTAYDLLVMLALIRSKKENTN